MIMDCAGSLMVKRRLKRAKIFEIERLTWKLKSLLEKRSEDSERQYRESLKWLKERKYLKKVKLPRLLENLLNGVPHDIYNVPSVPEERAEWRILTSRICRKFMIKTFSNRRDKAECDSSDSIDEQTLEYPTETSRNESVLVLDVDCPIAKTVKQTKCSMPHDGANDTTSHSSPDTTPSQTNSAELSGDLSIHSHPSLRTIDCYDLVESIFSGIGLNDYGEYSRGYTIPDILRMRRRDRQLRQDVLQQDVKEEYGDDACSPTVQLSGLQHVSCPISKTMATEEQPQHSASTSTHVTDVRSRNRTNNAGMSQGTSSTTSQISDHGNENDRIADIHSHHTDQRSIESLDFSRSLFIDSLSGGQGPDSGEGSRSISIPRRRTARNRDQHGRDKKKKNRLGQRARRKKWLEEYGDDAKHLRKQRSAKAHLSVASLKKDSDRHYAKKPPSKVTTKHTLTAVSSKSGTIKKKESSSEDTPSTSSLHPSWEASKRRREQEAQIKQFKGQRIVFNVDSD